MRLTYAAVGGDARGAGRGRAPGGDARAPRSLWCPELHRSATVTAAALAAGDVAPHGSAPRSRWPSPAARWSPRWRRSTSTSCPAAGSCSASAPACSGSTRTGTTRQLGKPVGHLRETVRNIRAVLGRLHHRRPRSRSTASSSRCASAATSGPTRVSATGIPVYLAAMGPADDPAGRRDRRRLDQPRAVLAALPARSASCPSSTPASAARTARPRRTSTSSSPPAARSTADPAQARRRAAGVVGFYATVRTYADFFDVPRPRRASSRPSSTRSAPGAAPTTSPAPSPTGWSTRSPWPAPATRSPRGSPPTTASPTRSSSARRPTGSPAAETRAAQDEIIAADRRAHGSDHDEAAGGHPHHRASSSTAPGRSAACTSPTSAPRSSRSRTRGSAATSAATCRRTPRTRTRSSSRRSTATSAASPSTWPPPPGAGLRGPGQGQRRRLLQPARRRAGEAAASRYDDLKHLNPRIVCCLADRLRHDRAARARSPATTTCCRASPAGWS